MTYQVTLYRAGCKGQAGRIRADIEAPDMRDAARKAIRIARIVNLRNTGFGQVGRIIVRAEYCVLRFNAWQVKKALEVAVN